MSRRVVQSRGKDGESSTRVLERGQKLPVAYRPCTARQLRGAMVRAERIIVARLSTTRGIFGSSQVLRLLGSRSRGCVEKKGEGTLVEQIVKRDKNSPSLRVLTRGRESRVYNRECDTSSMQYAVDNFRLKRPTHKSSAYPFNPRVSACSKRCASSHVCINSTPAGSSGGNNERCRLSPGAI